MPSHNSVFPTLVTDVDLAETTPGGLGSSQSRTPLRTTVQNALREILGWRPRVTDPRGFQASLASSFHLVEEGGRKRWEWRPHSFTVQTDMGAVTGAQASLYRRAQVALEQCLPLVEELLPLSASADSEDIEASRAIITSDLTGLVNEIGQVGGPRVQRVNAFFDSLLGEQFNLEGGTDPEDVGGQLGRLRRRLSLDRDRVNTIEEEQNLTNFLVLTDYVIALRTTWQAQQHYFDRRGTDVFLGTQLVLVHRDLNTLAESVQELRFLLDSVFINEAERQSIELVFAGRTIHMPDSDPYTFPDDEPPMTVAELLNWVEEFASDEALRLIREGGKDGVTALQPTMDKLRRLLRGALTIAEGDSSNPTPGFHTDRVQRGLHEATLLADTVFQRITQVQREGAPTITSVVLSEDDDSMVCPIRLDIQGSSFDLGAQVFLRREKTGEQMEAVIWRLDTTRIGVGFPMEYRRCYQMAPEEELILLVINPDGELASHRLSRGDFAAKPAHNSTQRRGQASTRPRGGKKGGGAKPGGTS